jgi:predicted nucleotidyltransferase
LVTYHNFVMPPGARRPLDAQLTRVALEKLDALLDRDVHLVIGGGGAMILAYGIPLRTEDVDAFPRRSGDLRAIQDRAREVASELDIVPDWLNQHFETFVHVLPSDYAARLRRVLDGKHLKVDALGPEDLLIMKCMAGRDKDRPHARRLLREATDLALVDRHLSELAERRIPKAEQACEFFDALKEEAGL